MKTKANTLAVALFGWLAIGAKDCSGWGWGSSGYEGYTTGVGAGAGPSCGTIEALGGAGGGGVGGGSVGAVGVGGASVGSVSAGVGGGSGSDPGDPSPQGLTCGGGDDAMLLEGYLQGADQPDPTGGVTCGDPTDCVNKCVAQSKYCWAEHAVHPYKPPMVGDLFQCIDSIPPASLGGSYTCLYQYPNGDACIFAHAAKLGPITLPAPPPLCVYKSP